MDEKQEDVKVDETKKDDSTADKKPATVTAEDLQKQLDELTRHAKNKEEEAARVQKKLEKYQADEEQRKKDALSEVDRLKLEKQEALDKAATLESKYQAETIKHEIFAEAGKAQFGETKKQKFIDAETAYALLSKDEIEKGIPQALANLAKSKPFLLESVQAGDGVGSPKAGKSKTVTEEKRNYPIPRF
jgi:hypothetical protein